MLHSGSVRRRQGGVLVVCAAEPQVPAWLRAAGQPTRSVGSAAEALTVLDDAPADLVVIDREPDGMEVADCCAALRADPRLEEAWLLAITGKGRCR